MVTGSQTAKNKTWDVWFIPPMFSPVSNASSFWESPGVGWLYFKKWCSPPPPVWLILINMYSLRDTGRCIYSKKVAYLYYYAVFIVIYSNMQFFLVRNCNIVLFFADYILFEMQRGRDLAMVKEPASGGPEIRLVVFWVFHLLFIS